MAKKKTKEGINPTIVNILKVVAYVLGLFLAGIGTENTAEALNLMQL